MEFSSQALMNILSLKKKLFQAMIYTGFNNKRVGLLSHFYCFLVHFLSHRKQLAMWMVTQIEGSGEIHPG